MCLTLFRHFFQLYRFKDRESFVRNKSTLLKKPFKDPNYNSTPLKYYELRRDLGVTFVPVRSILIYVYLEKKIKTHLFFLGG